MFKVGYRARCIDNRDAENYLTIGKTYEINNIDGNYYVIINDKGNTDWYVSCRFELVKKEHTKKKMKFVPMDELEVISVNGIDGILIPE